MPTYDNIALIKEHQRQLLAGETSQSFPAWLQEKNPSEYKRWKPLVVLNV